MSPVPLHHDLARAAAEVPDLLAVRDGASSLTFAELEDRSSRVAAALLLGGVRTGDRVAYFLGRGAGCVTAALGILKAGGAYVPVDRKTPPDRWERILRDARPSAVVCDPATLPETLSRLGGGAIPPVVCLGPEVPLKGGPPAGREIIFTGSDACSRPVPTPDVTGEDLAYVLYTSGSTGEPKGVMITHANVANYIDWAVEFFALTPSDRILGTAPFHFDMSTFDIFAALRARAPLFIATEEQLLFPVRLAGLIEENRITVWKGVSSLLMYMCRSGVVASGRMPSMRAVIFAGEQLAAKHLAQWMLAFPEKAFFNAYGPTEATGISLCHRVRSVPGPGDPVPIGVPCRGARVLLLSEDGGIAPPGEPGEILIGGPGVGKGYLNDPVKTLRHFGPDPLDPASGEVYYRTGDLAFANPEGEFVFLSRKDHQVKWMGYRIELAEIENALLSHPAVRDSAVLLLESGRDGLAELVAFLEGGEGAGDQDILLHLRDRLPPYMVPKRLVRLGSLPRNDRGKVARDLLKERAAAPGDR